jgi:hypothetical protein
MTARQPSVPNFMLIVCDSHPTACLSRHTQGLPQLSSFPGEGRQKNAAAGTLRASRAAFGSSSAEASDRIANCQLPIADGRGQMANTPAIVGAAKLALITTRLEAQRLKSRPAGVDVVAEPAAEPERPTASYLRRARNPISSPRPKATPMVW